MIAAKLSFSFVDKSRGHEDLYLRLAEKEWACDSYYLALDDKLLPGREDAVKICAVLLRLLQQWLAAVERLSPGGVAFLPYDFSDQYTGWLRCERRGDSVLLFQGWSPVEGWSFSPSAIPHHFIAAAPDFKGNDFVLEISIQELREAIHASMQQLA